MTWLDKYFNKLALAFMIFMHVIALRDEATIRSAIGLQNGLLLVSGEKR